MVNCSSCGAADAPSKCSKCLSVSYCNSTCQLNHWNEHKKVCIKKKNAPKTKDDSSPVAVSDSKPIRANDNEFSAPSKMCIARIHTDLKALRNDPLEGIFVEQDEEKINRCHAIVLGPSDTPYEFGFFYFQLLFPDQYPCVPPRVTLQTTGGGTVRFNPNLYANGKVCLSVLGTWHGPAWSPAQNIGSVLLSIRSLLNSEPYFNEPGFENKPSQESKAYNHLLRHETIRIAVLDMVKNAPTTLPERLASVVSSSFFDFCEVYKYTCDEYSFLDGKRYRDLLSHNTGTFSFMKMKERLEQLQEEMELRGEEEESGETCNGNLKSEGESSSA